MRRRTVLAAASIALAGCAAAEESDDATSDDESQRGEAQGTGGESDGDFEPEAVEAAIVDQLNAVRFDAGVENLGRDSGLRLAAREHSIDMHERDFFAHQNPDGEEPWHRAPCDAAETLYDSPIGGSVEGAAGDTYDTTVVREAAAITVAGWVESPPHYDIMTDDFFEQIGVGVHAADGRFLVTAKYC